jgi:nucleoside-diphosphate-sugar epimerase
LQTRSFCYVDDLVEGLVRLMATSAEVTGPVNIGNPTEYSILELARHVVDLVGSHSRLFIGRSQRMIQNRGSRIFRARKSRSVGTGASR